jgi:pimeloyl-ACP methyl ester carboxylesterase
MDQVYTRQAVAITNETNDDWMTKEIAITVVRPQDAKTIKSDQDITLQDGAAKLLRHPTLQAKANLTTVPQVRSLGSSVIPAILQSDASVAQPFQFTTSRGSDPGLSALELSDVQNPDAVTSDTPLRLEVNTRLGEGEYLLPVAYDGEFFLPLGRAEQTESKTEIILDRLPAPQPIPTPVASRSLHGSVWIFFQKVLSQKLGHSFKYPRLAIANVTAIRTEQNRPVDYKVEYLNSQDDQDKVRTAVSQAKRIVLFIHGIIGDTESMLPSLLLAKVQQGNEQRPLKELYDLVLAFDYENLNTTIEENAKKLGERLQEIGLSTNHGKELHIVAHSMGGLVSRWFIEQEGGHQVVQHLVMLGTPNAGSPWPTIQDWAFTALGVGLNQLSSVIWPAKVIANLLDFLDKKATMALNQMQPDSEFIQKLKLDPIANPGIPYTIIAGDRSLTPIALQPDPTQDSPFQRLVKKLLNKAVDKVVDTVFFNEPNDIAVHLTSIKGVQPERSSKLTILEPDAACDHLTYFTNPEGLKCLVHALFSNAESTSTASNEPSQNVTENNPPSYPSEPTIIATHLPESSPVASVQLPQSEPLGMATLPEASPESSAQIASHSAERPEERSGLNIRLVAAITALVIAGIVGLFLWKRSVQERPATQNQSNQSLTEKMRPSDVSLVYEHLPKAP